MIRTRHDIDTRLLTIFICDKVFDDEINEALINWHSALGNLNHQITRTYAMEFLKKAARKVLTEIDYPYREREDLIRVFEPLELLLRTALPLKTENDKAHNVRDHLSHTIRNILFSNYLLKKFNPENYSGLRMQLVISVIFHDLAYPIEKIKKVAHKLGDATFTTLLNSRGDVEIELSNAGDLLKMLDFFGNLAKRKKEEIESEKDAAKLAIKTVIYNKLKHIYREIISKAIAGIGLFDSSHSISSVVLFLMPIVKNIKEPEISQEINLSIIADICLAMTYHDRGNLIQKISDFEIPLILRIMRITDELQEWDREQNSFIKDAIIINDVTSVLNLRLIMKNKGEMTLCRPDLFIPDKINGLLPALIAEEAIKLEIEFPQTVNKTDLERALDEMKFNLKKKDVNIECDFEGNGNGKIVKLYFKDKKTIIQIN